jgi:predicted transcriptional regulator
VRDVRAGAASRASAEVRPEEIAQKLGLSTYTVTQIILAARNQGKL